MISVWPAVTGDNGTMARESGHRRTTLAGARPSTIAQNGHSSGDARPVSTSLSPGTSVASVVKFHFLGFHVATGHPPRTFLHGEPGRVNNQDSRTVSTVRPVSGHDA